MNRPNVILICSDQQRSDSLGCAGHPYNRTPNIDTIAKRGSRLTRHMVTCQICGPSRASMFTGMYPHEHGNITNGSVLDPTISTLPGQLADMSYRTHGIGKFHFQPIRAPSEMNLPESYAFWRDRQPEDWSGPYYGFQNVEFVIGDSHRTVEAGHYGKWLKRKQPGDVHLMLPENALTTQPDLPDCWQPAIDPKLHYNSWIADRAAMFLRDVDEPFFLFVSFPDPHHPFAPPGHYAQMYDPADVTLPTVVEGELDQMPPIDPNEQGGMLRTDTISEGSLRQAIAYTSGMVTMIDDCVGRVLDALDQRNLRDNTYIIYTSDHGELLGDHGLLRKGPIPYRSLCHVPFLIEGPGIANDTSLQFLTSHIDLMPTILELCGQTSTDVVSLARMLLGGSPPPRAHVFGEYHPIAAHNMYNQTLHSEQCD